MYTPDRPEPVTNSHIATEHSISGFFRDAYDNGLQHAITAQPKEAAEIGASIAGGIALTFLTSRTGGRALSALLRCGAGEETKQVIAPASEALLGKGVAINAVNRDTAAAAIEKIAHSGVQVARTAGGSVEGTILDGTGRGMTETASTGSGRGRPYIVQIPTDDMGAGAEIELEPMEWPRLKPY